MVRLVAAAALTLVMALGSPAATPAGADPADTWLPRATWSPQYDIGGCLYKVVWGNFSHVPYTVVRFYNLSACGGAIVIVEYTDGTTEHIAGSSTVNGTGTDGCGAYQQIQAGLGTSGFSLRGLVWLGTGYRWYATDGLNTQPIHAVC